jgi:hypothetical protein
MVATLKPGVGERERGYRFKSKVFSLLTQVRNKSRRVPVTNGMCFEGPDCVSLASG